MSDDLMGYMSGSDVLPYVRSDTWCAVVFGPKGAGKSTTAYGLNEAKYRTAILDFDGNSAQTLKSNYRKDKVKNFKVWNIKQLINFKDLQDEQILLEAENVIRILEDKIYNELDEWSPDVVVADGYQRFVWLTEMAMRSNQRKRDIKNNSERVTGAFTGVANRSAWKERNWMLDRFYEVCTQAAKVGFIVTVHERAKPKEREDEEITKFEPSWAGALKEESQLVIRQTISQAGSKVLRWAEVESNKITGHTIVDLDITGAPNAVWKWIFDQEPQYLY